MHYRRLWVFLLLLFLPGCFQQAGEAFQPANSTAIPNTAPTTDSSLDSGGITQEPALTNFPATATLPPITLIAPTRSGLPTATVSVPILETPVTSGIQDATPVTGGQFRTPISPLGPITPVMPTPLSPGILPTATASGMITPTALPGADNAANCTHTVQPGENLYRIATNLGLSLTDLRAANPQVSGDLIQPGEVLQVPGCQPSGGEVGDNAANPPTPGADTGAPVVGDGTLYTVKSGDTLYGIAQRHGVTVQAIVDANQLTNPNSLTIGQQLTIPAPSG